MHRHDVLRQGFRRADWIFEDGPLVAGRPPTNVKAFVEGLSCLRGRPNVVHVPHIAGRTRDDNPRTADLIAGKFAFCAASRRSTN